MNLTKGRIAIAEACGYKIKFIHGEFPYSIENPQGISSDFYSTEILAWVKNTPDYQNDLNAMASAEDCLSDEQWDLYVDNLEKVCGVRKMRSDATDPIRAKAPQRFEAFLRTINRWEEE